MNPLNSAFSVQHTPLFVCLSDEYRSSGHQSPLKSTHPAVKTACVRTGTL